MKTILSILAAAMVATALHAEPKKLLVVTTTTGFRHASIPTLEAMLSKLAKDSGEFTVDFVQQPPNKPAAPKKPADLKPDALESAKEAHNIAEEKFNNDLAAFKAADAKWNEALKDTLQKLSPAKVFAACPSTPHSTSHQRP